jgi:hypothetical protein
VAVHGRNKYLILFMCDGVEVQLTVGGPCCLVENSAFQPNHAVLAAARTHKTIRPS